MNAVLLLYDLTRASSFVFNDHATSILLAGGIYNSPALSIRHDHQPKPRCSYKCAFISSDDVYQTHFHKVFVSLS